MTNNDENYLNSFERFTRANLAAFMTYHIATEELRRSIELLTDDVSSENTRLYTKIIETITGMEEALKVSSEGTKNVLELLLRERHRQAHPKPILAPLPPGKLQA